MAMLHSDVILERLLSLHPKEIDLSLGRLQRLLALLGNPERKLPPVIHVAGTNGKGSVVAYCRAVLEAAGTRVHVYTSPHLVRFHERIRIAYPSGSAFVAEDELAEALQQCETANDGHPITFFEITTAAAFLLYVRHPADYLVLEVGLGGRLDATNVIDVPAATAITPVSIDHVQFLGTTIEQIAFEKAGILKRNVACAVAGQQDDALEVIRRQAGRIGARLAISGEDWHAFEEHGRLIFQDGSGLLDLPLPRLPGRHQINNAGTAIATLRLLPDMRIDPAQFEAGLPNVDWPARMQRLAQGALNALLPVDADLWLDGGHNPAAGHALAQAMSELEERMARPLVLVSGMLNTKDATGFFHPFAGIAKEVIAVAIPGEKNSLSAVALAEMADAAGLVASTADSIERALVRAGKSAQSPRVLICGSLYLAGRVLAMNTAANDK